MNENPNKRENNKRTMIVEDTENGAVRITVAGPPYPVQTNNDLPINLLTCEIPRVRLSPFKHKVGDREAYSSGHCTDDSHGPKGCNGMCHYTNCSKPAEFFEHWRNDDGSEHCLLFCKWHTRDVCYRVGSAMLWALNYGVVQDLRFWTGLDTLSNGLPRCDFSYYAIDEGESDWARSTNEATTEVCVTEFGPEGKVYDAKACAKLVRNAILIKKMKSPLRLATKGARSRS